MSISRYNDRNVDINRSPNYDQYFKDRRIKQIKQYTSPILTYPTNKFNSLNIVNHIWDFTDRYFKLADKYYGNPKYWWVIAWFNQRPTEVGWTIGDTVLIPLPLEKILELLKV
ncbi:hypothetical protein M0R19_04140 [Candidatus Pacearchaeota archaeon]|jgi:hypothetical protein|nr:hypothetical protein [Candidatus Pacearchaeota archaeon]